MQVHLEGYTFVYQSWTNVVLSQKLEEGFVVLLPGSFGGHASVGATNSLDLLWKVHCVNFMQNGSDILQDDRNQLVIS